MFQEGSPKVVRPNIDRDDWLIYDSTIGNKETPSNLR